MELIGQRFGELVVTEFSHETKENGEHYICLCDCGKKRTVRKTHLNTGSVTCCSSCTKLRKAIELNKNDPMIGLEFGRLKVLECTGSDKNRNKKYKCLCSCGNLTEVTGKSLKTGRTKSCGCYKLSKGKEARVNLQGLRFGLLTVISLAVKAPNGEAMWLCKCDCGNEIEVRRGSLRSGLTRSCGCLKHKGLQTDLIIFDEKEALYRTKKRLMAMRFRCYNIKNKYYKDYGGRGITVCDRWMDKKTGLHNFIADMGLIPSLHHQIDRIDNDGPYSPENCIWTICSINNTHKRNSHMITYKGKNQCLSVWAKEMGLSYAALCSRLKRKNLTLEEALTLPKGYRYL